MGSAEQDVTSEPSSRVEIVADLATSFTYASFQNSIPIVRSITIDNRTRESFENCRLEFASQPAFFRPKTWAIDRIGAGDDISLSDRKLDLDPAYLAGLNEAERGEIHIRLWAGERLLDEQHIPVRLLARDEWGGAGDMAQLLPAFVMPNDPAVAKVLHTAAERLAAHGHPSGLDGYQTQNPQRAFMLVAAVYSAVAGLSLHYAEPPASFEARGQKIRRPSVILTDRLATCLDTTLLFAAALEAAGLNAVVLLFKGHAAVGCWLQKRTLPTAIETDVTEIRKALASREMIVFETTGVTHRPPVTLEHARTLSDIRLDERRSDEFVAAIDVSRSRSGGIMPLASHEPARGDDDGTAGATATADLPLPPPPPPGELPADVAEVKPTTAAGRIDRWQKKLLDLTLRNRLLNFPDTKRTVPFLCADVGYLEDRLAAGAPVRLISLPGQNPLGGRDADLHREVHGEDIQRRFAIEALQRDELASTLAAKELEARLIDLYRQVRNDFAEGGANTLFLAVGFLRWKKKPEDARGYRAPLLLVPVKLERRSATSRFALRFHEDEPRFNATLLQFLERDFDLKLPQFADDLPMDDNGVDVPMLLLRVRQAVRDVPGMEVVDETALSTFSFAKFLMWKDLVERTDALRQNRVVKHLIDTPDQPFAAEGPAFREGADLDRRYAPADLITLLPADSSQIAASLAAAEGRDFVIVGPPGTGKSQTIANMIAHCLGVGKTVLFVAEKTAALEVVYRRLREHGLGDHCLELHSSKSDRRSFVGQLKRSWESRSRFDAGAWAVINDKLRVRRDQLNAYVASLHRRYPNGLTPYHALGMALKGTEAHAPTLSWGSVDAHDETSRLALEELAEEMGLVFRSIESRPVFALVDPGEWSSAWQERLLKAAGELTVRSTRLRITLQAFQSRVGLPAIDDASIEELDRLADFAAALHASAGADHSILFDRAFPRLREAFSALEAGVGGYRAAKAELAGVYSQAVVADLPLEALDRQWREALASAWPKRWFDCRRIKRMLQAYASGGVADPARDLAALRRMRGHLATVAASELAAKPIGFSGVDSDLGAMDRRLATASRLRESLLRLGITRDELQPVARAIAPALRSGGEDEPARRAASDFVSALAAFREAVATYTEVSGVDPLDPVSKSMLFDLALQMDELIAARPLLRDWSTWCDVRRKARAHGLAPLVEDLETGAVQPYEALAAFRLAYSRWWLPPILDADPVLRDFRRFQHEHAIDDFRQIDDLVRTEVSSRVASTLAHGLPPAEGVARDSELGRLRHQMELQRPSRSIRELIAAMPQTFPRLAPCMLMSPLSIAQYLPPDQALFDVVIFDEASQITTWDAVGAIARARQTVIVGDPKQLPPTNFFGRNDGDGDGDGAGDGEAIYDRDLESILDEAKAAGLPMRDLRFHYRSRNESLIAFSNWHYYQNRLITFPAPNVEDRAVRLRVVREGIYDRGKSRTNRIEAAAVAAEASERMRRWLDLPEAKRPTLGIITFNAQQQSLIQDLLDEARRREPALEWFFAEDRVEPTIVKNLENVQGDERDLILFSITFAADAAGVRRMDFGALNRDGGERRLNVAVTRARQELIVFSGFTADQLDTERSRALGVKHLKTFLDYAERGAIALPAQDRGSEGGAESPFEEAVAAQLRRLGWEVVPQVGISGFRVDLGIRNPERAGAFLAGVECDGATYHSSATARDRDKVREQVLRGLGWNILRVWSTDWWFDPESAIDRLHEALWVLLERSRNSEEAEDAAMPEEPVLWDMGHEVEPGAGAAEPDLEPEAAPADLAESADEAGEPSGDRVAIVSILAEPPVGAEATGAAGQAVTSEEGAMPSGPPVVAVSLLRYRIADLAGIRAEPERFFEFTYRVMLRSMVDAVLDAEAPIKEDILFQRIARAHGWLRAGARIRERISLHLRDVDRSEETSGVFLWRKGTLAECIAYRHPREAGSGRAVADIPLAELAGFVAENPDLVDEPDPALALSRLLGLGRLSATTRSRLDEALVRGRYLIAAGSDDPAARKV